ncbi:MAG: alpha/beta hydrolase [Bacteriovoracaceae bacterium]|nr:alpha/beta hydrolase [Bacteriovoracaceae bacterium]
MNKVVLFLITCLISIPTFSNPIPDILQSRLNKKIQMQDFGEVSFRGPKSRSRGEKIVLIHGIYAGSTHITWRDMLPLLDQAGLQVYLVDLPGVGENGILEKRTYSMELFDRFITKFLEDVVKGPATLVAESLLTTSILKIAGDRPDLVKGLVLLSPTGINSLATGNPAQDQLYQRLYNNDIFADSFYKSVFTETNLRFFLEKTVYDDSLITDLRIQETQLAGQNQAQKWITISFVGGQLTRSFRDASRLANSPTLMIFGEEAESSGTTDDLLEKPEEFLKIRPDFELATIPMCGQSVHRERPEFTKNLILNFIQRI